MIRKDVHHSNEIVRKIPLETRSVTNRSDNLRLIECVCKRLQCYYCKGKTSPGCTSAVDNFTTFTIKIHIKRICKFIEQVLIGIFANRESLLIYRKAL